MTRRQHFWRAFIWGSAILGLVVVSREESIWWATFYAIPTTFNVVNAARRVWLDENW